MSSNIGLPARHRAGEALFLPAAVLVILEVVYWANALSGEPSPRSIVVPPPSAILAEAVGLMLRLELLEALARTLGTAALGFALGIFGAIGLGSVVGTFEWAQRGVSPTMHFLRSLPVVLYVPVALVAVGSDLRVPILLSALVTTLYGSVPVVRAVQEYDPEKIRFLRIRDVSRVGVILRFVLPEIVAAMATALSISVTLAVAITVVAEMLLPSLGGMGSLIIDARESSNYEALWALTILLGLVGFLFHGFVIWFWKWAAPWSQDVTAQAESAND